MGEKTPATTTQNTTSSQMTDPWSPATGLLKSLIGKYSAANTDVTPGQSAASGGIIDTLKSLPGFASDAGAAIGKIFGNSGMLNKGYDTITSNLGSMAAGGNLNPYDTPGLGDSLKTMSQDILNNVKGVYAGAGRNPSGAGDFAQTATRGLSQGLAPVLTGQYNTNVGNMLNANNTLYNAGNSTVGALNSNTMQALQAAGLLPGVATAGGTALLGAENTAQGLPYANLMQQLQAAGMLGGMGSSTVGTGQSVGTQTPANNPLMNWLGGLSTAGGLAGSFMASDERTKDDVEEVGKLHDGQKVYRFKFKGTKTPMLGLMAQEVEKRQPEAVKEFGGVKHVDYKAATRFSGAGMHRRAA